VVGEIGSGDAAVRPTRVMTAAKKREVFKFLSL
jgi:hypothetical protein